MKLKAMTTLEISLSNEGSLLGEISLFSEVLLKTDTSARSSWFFSKPDTEDSVYPYLRKMLWAR